MIFSPFLGAFHSFDSAIVEKTTKRPEGGREGGKEGERERGGQAIAVLVIRSALPEQGERKASLGKGGVPLCKTAQGSF